MSLLYMMAFVALACMVGSFWWRVGFWLWRNGRDAKRKAERFRDSVLSAYKEDDSIAPR